MLHLGNERKHCLVSNTSLWPCATVGTDRSYRCFISLSKRTEISNTMLWPCAPVGRTPAQKLTTSTAQESRQDIFSYLLHLFMAIIRGSTWDHAIVPSIKIAGSSCVCTWFPGSFAFYIPLEWTMEAWTRINGSPEQNKLVMYSQLAVCCTFKMTWEDR